MVDGEGGVLWNNVDYLSSGNILRSILQKCTHLNILSNTPPPLPFIFQWAGLKECTHLIRYRRISLLPWLVLLLSIGLFSKTKTTKSFGLFSKQTHQREPFTAVTKQHITPEDTTKLPKSIPFNHTIKKNIANAMAICVTCNLQDNPQLLPSLK